MEKPLPRSNKPKRGRPCGADERRQWAEAVVRKATPKVVQGLIDAAASLGERAPSFPSQPANQRPEEVEDESLAALLLRLLRVPEEGDPAGNADTHGEKTGSENPPVG